MGNNIENKVLQEYEVQVIINDKSGVGYGFIHANVYGSLSVEMFQNRFNNELIDQRATNLELCEDISIGKSYWDDVETITEGVNKILSFYFIKPINEIDVKRMSFEKELLQGIDYLRAADKKYHVFLMKWEN